MSRLLVFVAFAALLPAKIIDRVAIYSGTQVITELQLDEEIRVTAFLNRQPIVRTAAARRAAAQRLIDQMLVEREMQLSRYPLPDSASIARYFYQVKEQFGTAQAFDRALATYNLRAAVLRAHLALQLTMMRFIDYRFRPDVTVSDAQIASYYRAHLRSWEAEHPGTPPPSLTASREAIRNSLVEQRADQALNDWLEENRKQVRLVYLDRTLQ